MLKVVTQFTSVVYVCICSRYTIFYSPTNNGVDVRHITPFLSFTNGRRVSFSFSISATRHTNCIEPAKSIPYCWLTVGGVKLKHNSSFACNASSLKVIGALVGIDGRPQIGVYPVNPGLAPSPKIILGATVPSNHRVMDSSSYSSFNN